MATVKFGYAASSNITFRGEIDTGIEREEWDEMSKSEQDDVFSETLFELVDIYLIED